MKKEKLDDEMIDDVVGGIISSGRLCANYSDGKINFRNEMNGRTTSMTENELVDKFVSSGCSRDRVNKLVEIIKSDKSYCAMEVKHMTGISF